MHVKRSCMLPKSGGSVAESGELSTRDLIALAQSGDREAFDPLYRRFAGRLMGYALVRARGNRPLAEDVTSEVWARIIAYIGSWEDRGGNVDHSFFGMLCAAVRQRLGQHYAARWRETCHGSLTADEEFDGGHLVNVAPIHDDDNTQDGPGELADRLRAVVDGLHLTARQVVQLRLDGLTNAQIAARLDMTGQRVNQVWQQA